MVFSPVPSLLLVCLPPHFQPVAPRRSQYYTYLEEAGKQPNSLHVVYINTSLMTKALADRSVPTITCTSSNVVQTILQTFAQVPDAHVWYGPDTYMGRNVAQLFQASAFWCLWRLHFLYPGAALPRGVPSSAIRTSQGRGCL